MGDGVRRTARRTGMPTTVPANSDAETPRVVHVIAPSPMGGAERVVRLLAGAQYRRFRSSSVVALLDPSGPEPGLVESLREAGVPTVSVRSRHRGYLTEIRQIAGVIRREDARILHCHGYRADVLGFAAARLTNAPVVSTAHGFTGGNAKNRFYERLDRWCLRRMQGVIAVSHALEEQLLGSGVPRSRLWHIPNACAVVEHRTRAEARTALGITSTATVVGWIGRMSKEKAPDVLLRAIKCLGQSEIETLLIGDGREMGPTAQLASDLGLCSRVHFAGAVPEASKLMKAFDVFVISSHTEGLPMVLLEAMGAGVPVVATAVGEIPEVLDRGRLGTLVPPGAPKRLAQAIHEALRDRAATSDRALLAQQHVADQYAIDPWVGRTLEAYEAATISYGAKPHGGEIRGPVGSA